MRFALALALVLGLSSVALAQGPGIGNLRYESGEVFQPISFLDNEIGPRGSNVAIMIRGYLMIIFAPDSGRPPGEIAVWDVSDPRHPVDMRQYWTDGAELFREAHSLPQGIVSGREYVAVQTIAGVQFWDFTDPLNAFRASTLDLPGISGGDYDNVAWQATWQGRYLFVSGSNQGVYVIDAMDPVNPQLVSQVSNSRTGGFRVGPLFTFGDRLMVTNMDQDVALSVLDIRDPGNPGLLGSFREQKNLYSTLALGDRLYGAGRDGSITIYSLTDPTNLHRLSELSIGGDVLYVARQDDLLYAGRQDDFVKIDISNELAPVAVGDGTLSRDHPDHGQVTPLGNLVFIGNDHGTGSAFFPHQAEEDRLPPRIDAVFPEDGSVGVPVNGRISVDFSDAIDTSTLTPENLTVRAIGGGAPLEGIYTYCFNAVSFSPREGFELDTTYELVISTRIHDVMGNPVAGEQIVRFSTGNAIEEPPPPPPPEEEEEEDGDLGSDGTDLPSDGATDGADGSGEGDGASDEESPSEVAPDTTQPGGCSTSRGGVGGLFPLLVLGLALVRRRRSRIIAPLAAIVLSFSFVTSAYAIAVTARANTAKVVGKEVKFAANAVGTGTITYSWDFGDGVKSAESTESGALHVYDQPGHYAVIVVVKDDTGSIRSDTFIQTVHRPLPAVAPVSASSIVLDRERGRACNVNTDEDTVSCIDTTSYTLQFEAPVGDHPGTLAVDRTGQLWIANQDDDTLTVLTETGETKQTIALPYGSRPYGLVVGPARGDVYVSLQGRGQVRVLDARSGARIRDIDAGVLPTGLTVSHDEATLFVSRFVSPKDRAEITRVDLARGEAEHMITLGQAAGPDGEDRSRGVPNYLRALVLQPDESTLWVPSKQDNNARGLARDGLPLTFETSVRTILSQVDVASNLEMKEQRTDLNNRSLGLAAAFSPRGDYAFVALTAVNGVEVVDAYNRNVVSGLMNLPAGPDGLAVDEEGRVFVNAFLARKVLVLDAHGVLDATDFDMHLLAEVDVVQNERMPEDVLLGKRIFYDASDARMAQDGYISCAVCHLDGFEDGIVWDFTDRGEGLRNTTSLLGKRGTGQGRLHWSANFDEVQDFEHDIRNAFGGTGFLPDDGFRTGTRDTTLGDLKAGLSPELDALSAFVTSLDRVHRSPYRQASGALTKAGWRGSQVFVDAGCAECHSGPDFTDSPSGVVHDVGTLRATSGQRLGMPLTGLDTPSLRGIWETAPYLHDGSAETLAEVLSGRNPDDLHGKTQNLTVEALADLEAYLLQIDNTAREDEVEPPDEPEVEPDAGVPSENDAGSEEAPGPTTEGMHLSASTCAAMPGVGTSRITWLAFVIAAFCARRRRALSGR